jgi:hypothetical protein
MGECSSFSSWPQPKPAAVSNPASVGDRSANYAINTSIPHLREARKRSKPLRNSSRSAGCDGIQVIRYFDAAQQQRLSRP